MPRTGTWAAPRRDVWSEDAYPGGVDLSELGKVLLIVAAVIAVVGLVLIVVGRVPRVPGDIAIERENFRFYFPIGTSIIVSIVLSVLLTLFLRR